MRSAMKLLKLQTANQSVFFLKIGKEIGKAWSKSLTRVFSLIPDLLFDCSRVLEYAKIRTVLQSIEAWISFHFLKTASLEQYFNCFWNLYRGRAGQLLVCYTVVFSVVTQSSSPQRGEERCVTTLKGCVARQSAIGQCFFPVIQSQKSLRKLKYRFESGKRTPKWLS